MEKPIPSIRSLNDVVAQTLTVTLTSKVVGGSTSSKRAKNVEAAAAPAAATIELTSESLLPLPAFADIRPKFSDLCVRRAVFPTEVVSDENIVGWRAVVSAKKVDKAKVIGQLGLADAFAAPCHPQPSPSTLTLNPHPQPSPSPLTLTPHPHPELLSPLPLCRWSG